MVKIGDIKTLPGYVWRAACVDMQGNHGVTMLPAYVRCSSVSDGVPQWLLDAPPADWGWELVVLDEAERDIRATAH